MNIYGYIYIGVLLTGMLSAIVFLVYKSYIQRKVDNECFKEEDIQMYAAALENFRKKYQISSTDSVIEMAEKAGFDIVEIEKKDMEAGYEGRVKENTILILKNLSFRKKNDVIAHELAHFVNNNMEVATAGCKAKTILPRDKKEQVCDYIASILLVSNCELEEIMTNHGYEDLSNNSRTQLIMKIADEKNISISIVAKRIREIRKIQRVKFSNT